MRNAAMLASLVLASCGAVPDDLEPFVTDATSEASETREAVELDNGGMCADTGEATELITREDGERIGEAAEPILVTRGDACKFACLGAAGAGCAAVALACSAGVVWTVGSVSIPCQYAVVAACYALTGATVYCARVCA